MSDSRFYQRADMKWRDHKRLAAEMATAFGLQEFRDELVRGSVEPDTRKGVVHVWGKAKRTARARMYRARKAFLKGDMKNCARLLGIVSHYIEDGFVHGAMDTFSHTKDHSTVEGEIGARSDISAATPIDSVEEGLMDGEFVSREIDALVRQGAREGLGKALSLLGSSVLSPPDAPTAVAANHRRFVGAIRRPALKIIAGLSLVTAVLSSVLLGDPLWLLLLPFCLLWTGNPLLFRSLRTYGWALALAAFLGFLDEYQWTRLTLGLIVAMGMIFLSTIPDPGRWSEKWYLTNK